MLSLHMNSTKCKKLNWKSSRKYAYASKLHVKIHSYLILNSVLSTECYCLVESYDNLTYHCIPSTYHGT